MSDEIKKVYEQYKHLDRLLSNIDYMSSDNFSGKIMHDLWQAVKSAQQSVHPTAAGVESAGENSESGGG